MARRPTEREQLPDPTERLDLNALGELTSPSAQRRIAKARQSNLQKFLGINPKAGKPGKPAARGKAAPDGALVEYIDRRSAWFTDPEQFPAGAGMEAKLKFCLNFAVLAPSSHNSQPWRFRIDERVCEVWADRRKALPVADPEDRELTISCGCALEHLRVALRRYGLDTLVRVLPDPSRPDLLARVLVRGKREASLDDVRMFEAIMTRRTTRTPFAARAVPASGVAAISEAAGEAGGPGVGLAAVAGEDARGRLARLIHEADVVQLGSRAFRRELALWMHHNRSGARDGMPGYALGMSELESLAAPLVVRTFDVGEGRGARDEDLARHSPVLGVVGSERDDADAWVRSGRALAAGLLRGAMLGVTASYLNQPVEVPEMRVHLKRLVPEAGWPQVVLRMGYGPPAPRTPRHGVDEVLDH